MKAIKTWLRKKFIDYLIHDLFVAVDANDLLKIIDGHYFYNGRQLNDEERDRLYWEADRFHKGILKKVIGQAILFEASKLIAYKSKTETDIVAGKLLIFWKQTVEELIEKIIKK